MGAMSTLVVVAQSLTSALWHLLWIGLVSVVSITVFVLVLMGGAFLVYSAGGYLFESASTQVVERRATIVPTLLAFIGAVSIPAAKDMVSKWSAPAAWALSAALALLAFLGASLANSRRGRADRNVKWTGYAILVIPLLLLIAGGVLLRDEWWNDFTGLKPLDQGFLVGGAFLYVVGIVTGLLMIRSRASELRG
jgi:hypothetical protein